VSLHSFDGSEGSLALHRAKECAEGSSTPSQVRWTSKLLGGATESADGLNLRDERPQAWTPSGKSATGRMDRSDTRLENGRIPATQFTDNGGTGVHYHVTGLEEASPCARGASEPTCWGRNHQSKLTQARRLISGLGGTGCAWS
jgi:hypothetical protein